MAQPKNKFFLTVGATTIEVFPNNFNKTKYTENPEKDLKFFRRKLSGKLIFINDKKTGITDFDKLFSIELGLDITFGGASKCTEIFIEIKKYCDGSYVHDWMGIFSTGGGKFDCDQCSFEIQPEVYDKYSCILSKLDTEFDILQGQLGADSYETSVVSGTMEYFRQETLVDECDGTNDYVKCYKNSILVSCGTFNVDEWCHYSTTFSHNVCEFGNPNTYRHLTKKYYRREVITLPCINSCTDPNPPDASWTLLEDNCLATCEATFFRCGGSDAIYTHLHKVNNILATVIGDADCDLEYSSIFFNYNPDIYSDFYALTNGGVDNYVTGDFSWTSNLMIAQKSDVKRPTAAIQAQHGVTTLKKMLSWLREMFNVYWDVSDDGKFIIEHFIFFENDISGLDLRTKDIERNRSKNKFEHTKLSVPRTEEFTMMEGEYLDQNNKSDFSNNVITYGETCSEEASSVSHAVDEVTTNLEFIAAYPDEIEESGFVMIATSTDGTNHYLNFEAGLISGIVRANAHLSWSNLVYNYHRYNRYLKEGEMNGNIETFFTYRSNCKQVPLTIALCCGDPEFNPQDQFLTELGQDIFGGVSGYVDSAETNNGTDILSITLIYPT